MDLAALQETVFSADERNFNSLALELFKFQAENCEVYNRYLSYLQIDITKISNMAEIPYLPISFFKNFDVSTSHFEPQTVFESSSTTGTGVSRHLVKSLDLYKRSFTGSFDFFYGDYRDYCHLALLPSYLERKNSSLVFQVNHFIQESKYKASAFFLNETETLYRELVMNEQQKIPTILWGVTFALLDFAGKYKLNLQHTTIIETGGMKGKRKEITRQELHTILGQNLGAKQVSGEYGMTELMSQAYASSEGLYRCPPWMRISAREINDPLGEPVYERHGAINVIDLANLHSCAFIATSDLGKVYGDGSFEILGRMDYSDTRGCNLLV